MMNADWISNIAWVMFIVAALLIVGTAVVMGLQAFWDILVVTWANTSGETRIAASILVLAFVVSVKNLGGRDD